MECISSLSFANFVPLGSKVHRRVAFDEDRKIGIRLFGRQKIVKRLDGVVCSQIECYIYKVG
jgi:hypothetical protein